MSTFAVTVEQIGRVWEHTNADRLEMASLAGKDYDFVVLKGQFKVGDIVIYFPLDSLLPMSLVETLGLAGKLAHGIRPPPGEERLQNRIKTVKLRGNISQGVVASPEILSPALIENLQLGQNLTEAFGVTKYEPPVVPSKWGNLVRLPHLVGVYDIESAQNHTQVAEQLMTERVSITEKLEGSHWAASLTAIDTFEVHQRNYMIEPVAGGEHDWHKVFREQGFAHSLRRLADILRDCGVRFQERITLRGEIIGPGIQGNIYGLNHHEVRIFELEVDGKPIHSALFWPLMDELEIKTVPLLAHSVTLKTWLGGTAIKPASDGESRLAPVAREGIVIKPVLERRDDQLGRVFLKQRSPVYLAKETD